MGTTRLEDLSDNQKETQTSSPKARFASKVEDSVSEFKPLILFLVITAVLHTLGTPVPEIGAFLAVNAKSLLNITVKQAPAPEKKKA